MDLKSCSRWYDYSRARADLFQATDTPWARCEKVKLPEQAEAAWLQGPELPV